tara:strand:- start:247 stop:411 length:165 start_codon:yes stop_codon:yes gene_type:complete
MNGKDKLHSLDQWLLMPGIQAGPHNIATRYNAHKQWASPDQRALTNAKQSTTNQ